MNHEAIARVCHEVNRAYCASLGDHESWLAEKQRDGWIYGPVKDPAKKEHPCLVPYDELPREQKVKDYLFQAVVRALASEAA